MSNPTIHERQSGHDDDRRRQELLAEDQPTEVNTFSPEKTRFGRRLLVGGLAVLTAGSLVAGGVFLGNRGEAKAPPVATAPADPTDQPSAAATEAQPTQSSVETAPSKLTSETFPMTGADGETVKGVEKF